MALKIKGQKKIIQTFKFRSFKPGGLEWNIFRERHYIRLNAPKIQNNGGRGKTQDSSQRESSDEYTSL